MRTGGSYLSEAWLDVYEEGTEEEASQLEIMKWNKFMEVASRDELKKLVKL